MKDTTMARYVYIKLVQIKLPEGHTTRSHEVVILVS